MEIYCTYVRIYTFCGLCHSELSAPPYQLSDSFIVSVSPIVRSSCIVAGFTCALNLSCAIVLESRSSIRLLRADFPLFVSRSPRFRIYFPNKYAHHCSFVPISY